MCGVGDAEAATEVELGQLDAMLASHVQVQPEDATSRDLEAAGVVDLAADVGVQTQQGQVCRVLQDATNRLCRLPPGEAEAELLVLVGGGDVLVGVGLDADGDPDHDRSHDAESLGRRGHPVDLLEGVDHDAAHPVSERSLDLGNALVVAVKADQVSRKSGADRHCQLSAGADVEVQAFFVDPPCHGGAQERLARVVDVGATAEILEGVVEGVLELPCARAEVVLVNDVCRCAELAGHLADVEATDGQGTRFSATN